jgi:hypothetical protein
LGGEVLCLLYIFDDMLVQPFVPDCAVVAFNVGVLPGLSGLDVLYGNALFFSPFQQLATYVFRAVVYPDSAGLSAPLDDPIETADYPFGWQEKSTSMPSPSRLKSSSTFNNRNADTVARHRFLGQTPTQGWPGHFFPRASFNNSACMLISVYIFFSRRFSSSKAFIWLIIDASIPPYFARHL